jgi:hypothetical protein
VKPLNVLQSMVLPALVLFAGSSAYAQTSQTVLANAAAAFSQGKPVNSVTLDATAQWIVGSDNEAGNAILTAGADGSFSIQLQLAQGSRTEAQTSFSSGQNCTWTGTDGVVHSVAAHNCMGSVAWFLPSAALLGGQQPSAVTTLLVSASATGAQQLLDIRQQRTPPTGLSSDAASLSTHLSTVDVYLDPGSYLPTALAFNVHPDQNCASDIPVQVTFTNYQTVSGVSVPFRIQRYINGVLNLDLTVTKASTN